MPPTVALTLFLAFIVWLFRLQARHGEKTSRALWLPMAWCLILGSRPLSVWFSPNFQVEMDVQTVDNNIFDRNVFLLLLVAGALVVFRRRRQLKGVLGGNPWLVAFYIYLALSVAWSDFAFVSAKRWIKEIGNLVMVLVVLSEANPCRAARTLIARCAFILIPLSVLFIKYFPEYGRSFNRWTWEAAFTGVAQNKNSLGALVVVSWIFLLADGLEWRRKQRDSDAMWQRVALAILFAMMAWLLYIADSQTSNLCVIIGSAILVAISRPAVRLRLGTFEWRSLAVIGTLVVLDGVLGLRGLLFSLFGREETLTGRTDIWALVLKSGTNPICGVGFYSYWMGEKAAAILDRYLGVNQAHSGYIETYLDGGIIGVTLFMLTLGTGYALVRRRVVSGCVTARIQLTFLVVCSLYNLTEGVICRMALMWYVMLWALLGYGPRIVNPNRVVTSPRQVEGSSACP